MQVSFANMGFMPLKRLLIERGVPKEEVNKASNKFLLKEIGDKYAEVSSSSDSHAPRRRRHANLSHANLSHAPSDETIQIECVS